MYLEREGPTKVLFPEQGRDGKGRLGIRQIRLKHILSRRVRALQVGRVDGCHISISDDPESRVERT
jgi:hypothetical protein